MCRAEQLIVENMVMQVTKGLFTWSNPSAHLKTAHFNTVTPGQVLQVPTPTPADAFKMTALAIILEF